MRLMRALFFLAVLAAPFWLAAQQSNPPTSKEQTVRDPGLYMTFETSMGNITCKLFEKEAPVTVHKIVGLAVGHVSYVDPKTRQTVAGKHFYDGLIFHRVIPNFMIQGGDPLGSGMGGPGGPGFPFKDEFVPALGFDVPGRLAMANSGPSTNGSQFFITEVPTPHLNGHHTIFGQCENLDVVKAIARVPKGANDMPRTPVVIVHLKIERVGPVPADPPEGVHHTVPPSSPAHHTPVKKPD
jgi:peptidyl-prolyl cis-trans isomerase A (cyclophilin A)